MKTGTKRATGSCARVEAHRNQTEGIDEALEPVSELYFVPKDRDIRRDDGVGDEGQPLRRDVVAERNQAGPPGPRPAQPITFWTAPIRRLKFVSMHEKDPFGDKLKDKERGEEEQFFAERERALLDKLRGQDAGRERRARRGLVAVLGAATS